MGTAIGDALRARLQRARADERMRVLVVLDLPEDDGAEGQWDRRARRQAIVARTKAAAGAMLPDIDAVLSRHGGERLRDGPDALGTVPIETTPAGVRALADLKPVRAILEDQPLGLLAR